MSKHPLPEQSSCDHLMVGTVCQKCGAVAASDTFSLPPTEQSESVAIAPVVDAGPMIAAPQRIGLCSEHGWWFPADDAFPFCPEGGCHAKVHLYRRTGVAARPHDPPTGGGYRS